jgi:DNA modification methylase
MPTLESIRNTEKQLDRRFDGKLIINPDLDRTLVSFQANKRQTQYRWFKYKEGFSASLVRYLLDKLHVVSGRLLDPFAGSGAALFGAAKRGLDALGIELLPVGCQVIEARKLAMSTEAPAIASTLQRWLMDKPWRKEKRSFPFSHLRITKGAFPPETETALGKYVAAMNKELEPAHGMLRFAALCILEEVSYTRKDGQYLRWDYRSGRKQGVKPFDKGAIPAFEEAITAKLSQIAEDLRGEALELFPEPETGKIELLAGSCLDHLPVLTPRSFDCLLTSPPYCNRYDYTRTYALELAFLGISEDQLRKLRQEMVSCTVENRAKLGLEAHFCSELLARAKSAFVEQKLLAQILAYLEARKDAKLLNNNGIPRMVRNYFREMAVIIFQCARLLKPGAPLIMVNDRALCKIM